MKGTFDDSETKRSDMHQQCPWGIIGISSISPQWKDHCIDDLTLPDPSCRYSLNFEKSFLGLVEQLLDMEIRFGRGALEQCGT